VNPIFNQRINWPWFIVAQFAFGITARMIVSRADRLRTWQHLPFSARAGLEEDEAVGEKGGPNA
jgi:hypothetical protein